jgi:ketosteroid isomerase-like protein
MADTQINDDRYRAFADGLQTFEKDGDASAFAALFGSGATAERLDARGARTDIEAFWQEYRNQFSSLSTSFHNAVEDTDQAVLEWTTEGALADGRDITYRGVTYIQLDGDKVSTLRTYYDSAQFAAIPADAKPA